MRALQFWKAVTMDRSDFLERLLEALATAKIGYCVIGGAAVNAYAEPVVTLDLDIAVAMTDVERAEELLSHDFKVRRFGPRKIQADVGASAADGLRTRPT